MCMKVSMLADSTTFIYAFLVSQALTFHPLAVCFLTFLSWTDFQSWVLAAKYAYTE